MIRSMSRSGFAGEVITQLTLAILHSSVATGRREDRQPARLLAEAVVEGAGDDAPVLGRFLEQLCGAVVRELSRAVAEGGAHLEQVEDISFTTIDWPRPRADIALEDRHGEFHQRLAYRGWERSLYDEARFDSSTERSMAVLLDTARDDVELWVRLHQGDLAMNWTGTGQRYHPDFLAAEAATERHGRIVRPCWVIEVKADNRKDDPEVVAKHEAAVQWASRVNADEAVTPDEWHVLLASESNIRDAKGSWRRLLTLARTDLDG